MDLQLAGRAVLVTGGASGIGEAITRELVAEGAAVVAVDRDAAALHALTADLRGVSTIVADLGDVDIARTTIEQAVKFAGRLDAIVNNAGVNDGVGLEHGDPVAFRKSLRANLHHYYDLAHYALPYLKTAKGSIVNIASKTAVTGQGNTSGYAAAKGGILALTREWAVELLPYEVRVNAIIPAEVITPQYRRWLQTFEHPEEKRSRILARIPLGHRMTLPEEIAAATCFLLSARAGHITGQHWYVDGGYVHLDRAIT
jgi:L-fucose dehydrogenase